MTATTIDSPSAGEPDRLPQRRPNSSRPMPGGPVAADEAEMPRLVPVLSAAFADNPVSDWLFHGEQDQYHPAFFTAFLRWAFRGGRVDRNPDSTAVAVWIDYLTPPLELLYDFQEEITDAVGRHKNRWVSLDQFTAAEHPTQPHWWLAFIGVLPASRSQGQAGRLLRAAQRWQRGEAAYLEATSRRLGGFYRKFGYEPTESIYVPKGPALHGMWRAPGAGDEEETHGGGQPQ